MKFHEFLLGSLAIALLAVIVLALVVSQPGFGAILDSGVTPSGVDLFRAVFGF